MNYITMPAGKPIFCEYIEMDYSGRYVAEAMRDYREAYEPQYERAPSLERIEASYLHSAQDARLMEMQAERRIKRDENDWSPFFRQPYKLYSTICKEVNGKMDEYIQAKLDDYFKLLEEIRQKTDDERTAVSLLQEVSKDRRMEQMRQEKEANNSVPATDKQKKFMTKLGIKYPKTVTKQEASVLIDEELGKNGV